MRRVLVCTFAAMALSVAPAAAQTLPGNTGEFYAGLHGGYVQQGIDGVFQRNANPAHPDALPFDLSSLDSNGSLFGVHAGYDIPLAGIFPRGMFVGIVGEYSKANIGEERTIPKLNLADQLTRTFTFQNDLNWVASLLARLGYKSGLFGFFGTLGWSWTDYEFVATSSCANATASTYARRRFAGQPRTDRASVSADEEGLAYGGGFIYDINNSQRLSVEYVHHDVGGTVTMDQLAPHGARQGKNVTIVDFDAIDVVQVKVSVKLN